MIVEGLLTSTNRAGEVNVAPMGPIVHGDFESLTLRPFSGSTTFQNLLESRAGVFHVVDDVSVIAETAIRRLDRLPETVPATRVQGAVLKNCCRWFEFEISSVDTSNERSEMSATIVHSGESKPFDGFNRAKHAVIEAAILATRVHILPVDDIMSHLKILTSAVKKTGSPREIASFEMLVEHIQNQARKAQPT